MKTISIVTTIMNEEEINERISTLMQNNKFLRVPGTNEWNLGDGRITTLRALKFEIKENQVIFETWYQDSKGEKAIDDLQVTSKYVRQLRAILDWAIKAVKSIDSSIEGYKPTAVEMEKINRNFQLLDTNKGSKRSSGNALAMAIIALIVILIGWIIMYFSGYVYYYFPVFSGILAISAIANSVQNGSKKGGVLALSIISIALSVLAVLMVF